METQTKIWLSSPHIGSNELIYVHQAFDTNWVAPLGPNVDLFEKALENYLCQDKQIAALSTGTASLHLALKLLDVSYGDTVICQSFTFAASANPITYLGATPIFVDSEPETWNISPDLMERAILESISNGKKPKAIIAVHLYGMPYKVDEIHEIALKYGIPVVEDSAESLGSSYKNQKCGTFGEMAILSFNGNKIITTSGGGALVLNNEELKKKTIFLATQARDNAPHYQHSQIGHNYRMSNVLAGIGRGQMEVLNERVWARRNIFDYYREHLSVFDFFEFQEETSSSFSNRWLTCILTPSLEARESIRLALLQENIESRPLWKPLHMQPVFQNSPAVVDGTSESLFDRGLCLPSGSNLSQEDLERIVSIIKHTI